VAIYNIKRGYGDGTVADTLAKYKGKGGANYARRIMAADAATQAYLVELGAANIGDLTEAQFATLKASVDQIVHR